MKKKLVFCIMMLGSFLAFLPSAATAQTASMCQQAYNTCVTVTNGAAICAIERDRCIANLGGGVTTGGSTGGSTGGGFPAGAFAGGSLVSEPGYQFSMGDCNYFYLHLLQDYNGYATCVVQVIWAPGYN